MSSLTTKFAFASAISVLDRNRETRIFLSSPKCSKHSSADKLVVVTKKMAILSASHPGGPGLQSRVSAPSIKYRRKEGPWSILSGASTFRIYVEYKNSICWLVGCLKVPPTAANKSGGQATK